MAADSASPKNIMQCLSTLLRFGFYPILSKAGLFRSWRNRRMKDHLTVVTYHGVIPKCYKVKDRWLDGNLIKADTFRQELNLLKSKYTVISPNEFLAYLQGDSSLPHNCILLTCDDGLVNNMTDMLPILKEQDLSCLFFVTAPNTSREREMLWHEELYLLLKSASTRQVQIPAEITGETSFGVNLHGRRKVWYELVKALSEFDHEKRLEYLNVLRDEFELENDWRDSYVKDPIQQRRYSLLSGMDMEILLKAGMALGSHTCTHPVLSLLPSDLAREEIEGSRRSLEQKLGIKVWAFSYPFGEPASVTPREHEFVKNAGYRCAFVNYGGLVRKKIRNYFSISRLHVSADMRIAEFEAHVSGFHGFLKSKFVSRLGSD
jgi:peptidoglycan/xylan/chitin deacetylase (PgdA/CDA1 family)